MTYDYSNSNNPGPSSPIKWAIDSASALLLDQQYHTPISKKILMGINLYGNKFIKSERSGGPILSNEILEILKQKKPKIIWDNEAKEHYFYFVEKSNEFVVWFPTLKYFDIRLDVAKNTIGCGLSLWEIGQGMDYFYDLL